MTDRKVRVATLLQQVAATFIQHEANTDPMITVTRVSTSSDLKRATVFFTTIPDNREDDALIFLKRTASELRNEIKKKCSMKIIPHLEFEVDYGEKHRQHMDEIVAETGTESTYPEKDK